MKKLKDLIYDYNDIVIAIVIIVIAALVIFVKVSDIMAYPTFAKNDTPQSQDVDFSDVDLNPVDVDPVINPGTDTIQGNPEDEDPVAPVDTPDNKPSGDVKFEVKSGEYLSTVASNLKAKGLISDASAFVKKVEEMKLDNKLQIGEFTIPSGSSDEQIAHIITRTN